MAGNFFGTIFRITTWGESHGKALGVVIDGCPAGLELSEGDIQTYLDRRKPGQTSISTPRTEADEVEILSGVFEGRTTGTSISLLVKNTSQKSHDYTEIAEYYRPGHADYSFDQKYGFRDYRGGGRSSGRETIGRVAAGAIACKILKQLGITVNAYTKSIANIEIDESNFNLAHSLSTPTAMPDLVANDRAMTLLEKAKSEMDSVGGVVACKVSGMKPGIGDPVFEKLDANLAKAFMSVGSVKAVEIGSGCNASTCYGSENNDSFIISEGILTKSSNHAGGILGGISDGSDIYANVYIKPTPSIFKEQSTVNRSGENIQIQIKGRHDPIIVPRAVVVIECMAALTILDALLLNMTANMEHIKKIYE